MRHLRAAAGLLALATLLSCCSGGAVAHRAAGADCAGVGISSWSPDPSFTDEFVRYGNDNSSLTDWTGGDGTHSVRLPDGRTLWLADDPELDEVLPPPNASGQPYYWRDTSGGRMPLWVHNAALVMSGPGRLEQTLLGSPPGAAPASYFPDLSSDAQSWRWPVQGLVEPRAPGSAERVVRVLLWDRAAAPPPYLYGVPLATEVATLSLPSLRLESIVKINDQTSVPQPGDRVLYGTTAVADGPWTYVFGGDDGPGRNPAESSSHAYLARVPAGELDHPAAWRFWDGDGWSADSTAARPGLGDGARHGVGSSFTVVREGATWVLVTMDSGGPGPSGLATITSYWACSPQGPWNGPGPGFQPPLPADTASPSQEVVYNPQAHPEFGEDDGLLLSYDVNWLGSDAPTQINRNVALYRPRFVRVSLGPAVPGGATAARARH